MNTFANLEDNKADMKVTLASIIGVDLSTGGVAAKIAVANLIRGMGGG